MDELYQTEIEDTDVGESDTETLTEETIDDFYQTHDLSQPELLFSMSYIESASNLQPVAPMPFHREDVAPFTPFVCSSLQPELSFSSSYIESALILQPVAPIPFHRENIALPMPLICSSSQPELSFSLNFIESTSNLQPVAQIVLLRERISLPESIFLPLCWPLLVFPEVPVFEETKTCMAISPLLQPNRAVLKIPSMQLDTNFWNLYSIPSSPSAPSSPTQTGGADESNLSAPINNLMSFGSSSSYQGVLNSNTSLPFLASPIYSDNDHEFFSELLYQVKVTDSDEVLSDLPNYGVNVSSYSTVVENIDVNQIQSIVEGNYDESSYLQKQGVEYDADYDDEAAYVNTNKRRIKYSLDVSKRMRPNGYGKNKRSEPEEFHGDQYNMVDIYEPFPDIYSNEYIAIAHSNRLPKTNSNKSNACFFCSAKGYECDSKPGFGKCTKCRHYQNGVCQFPTKQMVSKLEPSQYDGHSHRMYIGETPNTNTPMYNAILECTRVKSKKIFNSCYFCIYSNIPCDSFPGNGMCSSCVNESLKNNSQMMCMFVEK